MLLSYLKIVISYNFSKSQNLKLDEQSVIKVALKLLEVGGQWPGLQRDLVKTDHRRIFCFKFLNPSEYDVMKDGFKMPNQAQ